MSVRAVRLMYVILVSSQMRPKVMGFTSGQFSSTLAGLEDCCPDNASLNYFFWARLVLITKELIDDGRRKHRGDE